MTRFAPAFAFAVSPIALAASADAQPAARSPPQADYGNRPRDHAVIPRMADTFKVTFDMRETTPLVAGHTPYSARISGRTRSCGSSPTRRITSRNGDQALG